MMALMYRSSMVQKKLISLNLFISLKIKTNIKFYLLILFLLRFPYNLSHLTFQGTSNSTSQLKNFLASHLGTIPSYKIYTNVTLTFNLQLGNLYKLKNEKDVSNRLQLYIYVYFKTLIKVDLQVKH